MNSVDVIIYVDTNHYELTPEKLKDYIRSQTSETIDIKERVSLEIEGLSRLAGHFQIQGKFDEHKEVVEMLRMEYGLWTDGHIPLTRYSDRSFVYEIIEQECKKQDEKWGIQKHSTPKWNMIFDEEKGEMCKAYIEGRRDEFMGELIQMAALIVQWLNCESYRNNKDE